MTTTMNNLEKLFQIAAMEQMFELMQKMKKDINYDSSVLNFTKNHELKTDELKTDELKTDNRVDEFVKHVEDLTRFQNAVSIECRK